MQPTAIVTPANSTASNTARNHSSRRSPVSFSSWIAEIIYVPATLNTPAYLAIFTTDTRGHSNGTMLYSDSDTMKLSSWVPGLLEAGCGGQSVGRAYHRIVKGKGYTYQNIPAEKVQELRSMLLQLKAQAV